MKKLALVIATTLAVAGFSIANVSAQTSTTDPAKACAGLTGAALQDCMEKNQKD